MRERLRRALRAHPLVPVAVAVILLVMAALIVPDRVSISGGEGDRTVFVPDPPAVATFLLVMLVFALLILFIVGRAKRPKRPPPGAPTRKARGWLQAIGFLLLPVLWLISEPFRDALDRLLRGPGADSSPVRPAPPGGDIPATAPENSAALGMVLTLALLALVLGTFYLIFMMSRREVAAAASGASPCTLQGAIALGIEDLQHIREPRAAVIACYSRLQTLAEGVGARHHSDTPAELMERLLGNTTVTREPVASLTRLFERARFSTHVIDEGMRHAALVALRDVRDGLVADD